MYKIPHGLMLLQHVCHGNCWQEHIDIIRKLIITNHDCVPTNFNSFPWREAQLVTPQHTMQTQWNAAAIQKHCAETHHWLYICPSEDTIGGQLVTNDEKIAIMTITKGSRNKMECGAQWGSDERSRVSDWGTGNGDP